jgi:predicted 2-oxoglutarate/Fe(II)-dependent dioxygenase YbiX
MRIGNLPGFLDADLCRRVRDAMDRGMVEPAEILDHGPALDREARRAFSIEIDPGTLAVVEGRLDAARSELSDRCGVPLSGREGAAFVRYSPGGFYRLHRDRAVDADWPGAARRLIALVVFLNTSHRALEAGAFTGGELLIYPSRDHRRYPIRITPRQGSLVAFDAGLLHEVRPVVAGSRDVIVDWYC